MKKMFITAVFATAFGALCFLGVDDCAVFIQKVFCLAVVAVECFYLTCVHLHIVDGVVVALVG